MSEYIPDYTKYSTDELLELYKKSRGQLSSAVVDAAKIELEFRGANLSHFEEYTPVEHDKSNYVRPIILAKRSARLGAYFIDGILVGLILLPIALIYHYLVNVDYLYTPYFNQPIYFIFAQIIYFSLNGNLLKRYGQSIGKRYVGIKIVKLDNSVPSLWATYFIRILIVGFLSNIIFVGIVFWLPNILLIFRNDRRCGHDLFADTKVINT